MGTIKTVGSSGQISLGKKFAGQTVRLDLNNPVFQRQLFRLSKIEQRNILNTLRKLTSMTPLC